MLGIHFLQNEEKYGYYIRSTDPPRHTEGLDQT